MSWMPRDLASLCDGRDTVTNCAPSTFLFLRLLVEYFGQSRDRQRSDRFYDEYRRDESVTKVEFDFIVVGAGSAGCVVANRLSEVSEWKVLLLEAGDEEPEVADVPGFMPVLTQSSIDWGFMTQPSPRSCLARDQGRCPWTKGKVMGGSSTINYMIYIRGHPLDYDEWESLGNPGWSYRDVLPYFKKSENNRNFDGIDRHYHGTDGYQTVERFPYQDQNIAALLNAYKEFGLEEFDQNSGRQIGTSLLQHTTQDGERLSTNGAFIRPIRSKRRNLEVRPNAMVSRVILNQKKAIGVEIINQHGQREAIYVRKEVILSAGTINNPKILMLSGIGPYEELNRYDIPIVQDLAIGSNLQDHTTLDGVVFVLSNKTSTDVTEEQRNQDIDYYSDTRRGPLSATGTMQVNAFVQTKYAADNDRADIQYLLEPTNVENFRNDPILATVTNVLPASYYTGIMVRPILLNPKSRGVIRLNDTDPLNGPPLIFANTFQVEKDLLTLVEGTKIIIKLLRTEALRKVGYTLLDTPLPQCEHHEFGTDDYWACCAMSYTTSIYHPVGTCKMGPKNDKDAVVDPKLRVYGIKNLRVIDSSVMPLVVRGNTNAPSIMIAEKGSDLVKDEWHKGNQFEFQTRRSDFDDFFSKSELANLRPSQKSTFEQRGLNSW